MALHVKFVPFFGIDGNLISITVMVPQVSLHVRAELFNPEFTEEGDFTESTKARLLQAVRAAYQKKAALLDDVDARAIAQAEQQKKISLEWTETDIVGGNYGSQG